MKKPVNINGKLFNVVSVTELAKMISRSTNSIREYERRGILPRSNFRLPPIQRKDGKQIQGLRVYTIELAKELQQIFLTITQGKKISVEQTNAIRKAFADEKQRTNG